MKWRLLLVLLLPSIAVADPGPAGEEAPPQPTVIDLSLDELMERSVRVKVASYFEESQLVVGSTVARILREDWRRSGARTLADALGSQPGMLIAPGVVGSTAIAVRGYANTFSTRGINVQLDGVPLNSLKFASALADLHSIQLDTLDRIELIRGPGSSLYGADAFHGVISLSSFEATENVLETEAEVGSDGYRRGALRLSQGIGESLRGSGSFGFNGNSDRSIEYSYIEPPSSPSAGQRATSERASRFGSWMGSLKLQSNPGRRASFDAGVYFKGHDQGDFPGAGRVGSGTSSLARDRDLSEGESVFGLGTLGATFALPHDLELRLRGSYWDLESERLTDRTRLASPHVQLLDEREHRADLRVVLRQLRNDWNTQWTAAFERSHLRIARSDALLIAPGGALLAGSGPDGSDGARREIYSGVLQAKTDLLAGRFHVLYGARYDHYRDDFALASGSTQHVSPRLGLIYQPSETSAIKLLYGNAQRLASATEVGGSPTILAAPLDPELIDMYELVFLKEARSFNAGLSLFRSKWKDAVLLASNPAPPPDLRRLNVGKNDAYGVEASLAWFRGALRTELSTSYVRSEDDTNGVEYGAFPRIILNADAGYRLPWRDLELHVHNRVHLKADEGPTTASIPTPPRLPDYWRTDVSLTWTSSQRKLDVFVHLLNAFDRDNFLPSVFSAENGIPDIPRTASVGVRWKY